MCLCALPALAATTVVAPAAVNRVQVHPFPNAIRYSHHNDDYTVRVRVPGGAWQDLYEYNVKVDLDKPQDASMVYFNFDGTVEVAVQKNNGTFANVAMRPDAKGVVPAVRGGRRPANWPINSSRLAPAGSPSCQAMRRPRAASGASTTRCGTPARSAAPARPGTSAPCVIAAPLFENSSPS